MPSAPASASRAPAPPALGSTYVWAAVLAVLTSFAPRVAWAAPAVAGGPVFVLTLWTEDADDPADALTQALRAQIRASKTWTLSESPQPFETLAIALRCPPTPDAACLDRIGDQLHATHYVWGTVQKAKSGEVAAEVHLWTKGRPQTDAGGTLPEITKDPADPTVRSLAARMWDELTGTMPMGTVVIHAGAGSGTVVVDGEDRDPLQMGSARISVPTGEHSISVRVPGFHAAPQSVAVTENGERAIEFTLSPAGGRDETPTVPPPEAPRSHVGAILGYSAIVVGAGLLVVGGVEGLRWNADRVDSNNDRASVPDNVPDVCNDSSAPAQDACKKGKDAKTASILAWSLAGAGVVFAGVGTWLVVADSHAPSGRRTSGAVKRDSPRVSLVPSLNLREQTLDLRVTF